MLVKVAKLQNYIISNESEIVESEIKSILKMTSQHENSLNANFKYQFKLQILILEFIYNLKQGNYGKYIIEEQQLGRPSSNQTSNHIPFNIIKEMDELLNKIENIEYEWMSLTNLKLICLTLSSTLFLFSGKFNHLEKIIQQGLNLLNNELCQFELENDKFNQTSIFKGNLGPFKNYLKFKYVFLERRFQMYLLKCDFKASRDLLVQMIEMLDTWSLDLKQELKYLNLLTVYY